jgi:hypothetical protein
MAELSALGAPVLHIDELLRISEIPDNVKLANRFSLGCRESGARCVVACAFAWFACPMALARKEFLGLGVFDEDFHAIEFSRRTQNTS